MSQVPRCNHGVAASGSHVYALGGWVGSEIGSSIERFDPVGNAWQVYGTMPRARYGFGIVAYQVSVRKPAIFHVDVVDFCTVDYSL